MPEGRPVRVLAIDDDLQDRKTAERLSLYGVECHAIQPPQVEDLAEIVLRPLKEKEVDCVLLDFRLDADSDHDGQPVTYRGGTIAAAIKERFPEVPIVLMTTEEKHKEYVRGNPRISQLFDHLILKSTITGQVAARKRAALEICDLVSGFGRIHGVLKRARSTDSWQRVARLLSVSVRELESLRDTFGGLAPAKAADIANWFLRELLVYPGPLLDRDEARARLGLTESSFGNASVQGWLATAKYEGVFGKLHPRWWERRLLDLLNRVSEGGVSAESDERAAAIGKSSGVAGLEAAYCSFCGGGLVQRTCFSCNETVDNLHNLAVRVDTRPVWALPPVVCFRCIQTGRDEENQAIRYGPGTLTLVEQLKTAAE